MSWKPVPPFHQAFSATALAAVLQLIDISINIDTSYSGELAESQMKQSSGGFVCLCEIYLTSSIRDLEFSYKNSKGNCV